MAHSLSAKKRIRQNAKRRMRNRAQVSAVKTQVKKFVVSARGSDVESVDKELRLAQKKIDKLAARGIIHKNKAARQKSQLAQQRNAMQAKA